MDLLRHILKRFVFFSLLIVLLSSCYTLKDKTLLQNLRSLPKYENVPYEAYKIQVNDELLFRVISTDVDFVKMIDAGGGVSQQNAITYRVYPDGTIDLPFISSIYVKGLTLNQAADMIHSRFIQIIPDAEVKLTLANKTYTIIGEAGNGIYPIYKDKMTIYQALAQSGTIALSGDRKHVKIIREKNNVAEILEFDLRPQSIVDSKYYYIYPNDIIYIQKESASFYKTNNYSSFLGLITSSISLFTTVFYYTKYSK